MKILRSYALKECIVPFLMALVVLTCIFLLGNLIQLANLVINKGVSLITIGKLFLLYIPVLIGYTLPIACLIGIIVGFSRMSTDNEILAIRASGVHIQKLLFPVVVIGFILSLLCIILNERVIPYAHHEQKKLFKNLGVKNPTALLEAGIFINSFDGQILFIHKIEGYKLYNITIYQPQANGPTRTIIAKKGEFTPVPGKEQIKLKLINGTADEPDLKGGKNFYKLNFDTYFITLDLAVKEESVDKKPKSMTLRELKTQIKKYGKMNVDTPQLETEYWRKITWSFSPLAFMFIGFPIAAITNKREKSANVVLAVVCAVLYYLLSLGCEALSVKQIADPALIMWVPNLVAAIIGSVLNVKCVS